ncbi:MAG: hypothetical protein ABIU09_06700 [Pyrinomonadaceae bacterium]
MKTRLMAVAVLGVLMLNLTGSTFADLKGKKSARSQATQLAMLLPASDGVVTLDVKRFFGVALPKLLTANQPMLNGILAKIDEMKAKTGIDIRQFEYIAAGVTAKKITEKEYDLDPVVIARGQINAGGLIGAAKLAANGKYREEKAGEKTIYVFAAKDIADQAKQHAPGAKTAMADKLIGKLSREIAVTTIDANTIAFGSLPLVRQMFDAKTTIGTDLTSLLGKRETSVASFAGKLPAGMGAFLPLDNDELGKNLDSIKYVYGNMDVSGDITSVNLTARTVQSSQAAALLDTLSGLQMVGKALLGGSKGADKQVYVRMIENAKFSTKGNEVMFDLQVPQSDIDILVGMMK